MIVILGLLVLVAAVCVAVAGVLGNSGPAHPGDSFALFGQHLGTFSTGQLFLYGIVVGAVAMLGLSMLLGVFTRRLASHGARKQLKGSQQETTDVRADRDRLAQQLQDEQNERVPAAPSGPESQSAES